MIEKLRTAFQAISEKFHNKKHVFQTKIDRWGEKGWNKVHQKGVRLMEQAEALCEELQQKLFADGEAIVNERAVKKQIKLLKKVYKQLHESTKPWWRQWLEAIFIALTLAVVLRHTIFSPYHVPTGSAEPNILVGDRIWGNKMAYYFGDVKHGDLVIFDDPRHIYDRGNAVQYLWQRFIGFPIPVLGLKSGPMNVVKRVVGVPGDTIEGRIENGKTVIYRNGKRLDEPYVNPFPLVAVKRTIGFVPFDGIGPIRTPWFLKRRSPDHAGSRGFLMYTYDPSKPYKDQPYYYMSEQSVVKRPETKEPFFAQPYSPTYTVDMRNKEFYSIDTFGPITLPKDMYWVMGDSRKNSDDSRGWGPLHRKFIRGRASFILFSIDSEEPFWFFDVLNHPIDFWTKHVRWNRFLKGLGESIKGVKR